MYSRGTFRLVSDGEDQEAVVPPAPTHDWVVHPGELLADELHERGMSKVKLAAATDLTTRHIYNMVKGLARITPPVAVKLQDVLGIRAAVWIRMQAEYDIGIIEGRKPLSTDDSDLLELVRAAIEHDEDR